jgi:hypothetical protein
LTSPAAVVAFGLVLTAGLIAALADFFFAMLMSS